MHRLTICTLYDSKEMNRALILLVRQSHGSGRSADIQNATILCSTLIQLVVVACCLVALA
jgi:hypothetical protein